MKKVKLIDEYYVAEVEKNLFYELFRSKRKEIFPDGLDFDPYSVLSEEERKALAHLGQKTDDLFGLYFWVFKNTEVVGWSFGAQTNKETFQMINSVIFPEHRRKGIYGAMLQLILQRLKAEGFQIVNSVHRLNNNSVIISKLKAGFMISGFTVNDSFGSLIELSYYFNTRRRSVLNFRLGNSALPFDWNTIAT